MLEFYTGGKQEAAEEVAKIDRAVHRMSDLIDVCLADDRLTTAVAALQLQPTELAALIEEICREKTELGQSERLQLTLDGPMTVQADPAMLRVAISNLVDNALKYSPVASGPVKIALDAIPSGARITVTDRGPGIPNEEAARVFEKFYRSPSATGTRGAGLGLYIVKQIVESHDGQIQVQPGSSGGTEFTICLPKDCAQSS